MNTNNIISTPEITGNIGSCKTELQQVINHEGFFTIKGYNVTTNSCNGQTNQTDYSAITVIPIFVIAFVMMITLIIIFSNKN